MPAEHGHVPTPPIIADLVAWNGFGVHRPRADGRVLLPGIGEGNIFAAVDRYCTEGQGFRTPGSEHPLPECVGVELQPELAAQARDRHSSESFHVETADFLLDPPSAQFDWVFANPPYTRYRNIDDRRRAEYADRFETATGQFPLYAPFVEQMLRNLREGGTLSVILPIEALTRSNAKPLRNYLTRRKIGHIDLLPDASFDRTVTTVLLTLENEFSEYHNLWVENVLPYGPRPVLEELGVDDAEAAADGYMEELSGRKLQLLGSSRVEDPSAEQSSLRAYADGGGR